MRPVILYRGREFEDNELAAAQAAGFYCTDSRMTIRTGDLIVPRYSALPFYREQERDVRSVGAKLINTFAEHSYIADIGQWYPDLKDHTPQTWSSIIEIPNKETGPFVVKGETNSKKFLFNTHFYSPDRARLRDVISRLLDDTLISQQKLYIRKFEPLKTYMYGLNNLPITKEYRYFIAYGQILSVGYYWSSHVDDLRDSDCNMDEILNGGAPCEFMEAVIPKIQAPAVTVDVAQKSDGSWTVIEINDLSMSGLSENDPHVMYKNLYDVICKNN
jgi:hypothetical protein